MILTTIDLNSGRLSNIIEVTKDDKEDARRLFGVYILPILKEIKTRPGRTVFFRAGKSHEITAWSRKNHFVSGVTEDVLSLRLSWETDRERVAYLLRLGYTWREEKSGRFRCPWILDTGGVIEIHMDETVTSMLVEATEQGGEWVADAASIAKRLPGLSNVP